MESRKMPVSRPVSLPVSYLKMVAETFHAHFRTELLADAELGSIPRFEVKGEVSPEEVVLAASWMNEGELAATTVYGSIDFDAKKDRISLEDQLAHCVDAMGDVFRKLWDEKKSRELGALGRVPLHAWEEVPLEWVCLSSFESKVFVKVDKAHLQLDALSDEWLMKHDPEYQHLIEKAEAEVEKLFVTGRPKSFVEVSS